MQPQSSGGFDRRTLLAFALMILVWIVFTQFIMPTGGRDEDRPAAREPVVAAEADRAAADAPPPGYATDPAAERQAARSPSSAAERPQLTSSPVSEMTAGAWHLTNELEAEERFVTVERELFTAVFSAEGGELRSWKLADYTDADEAPVDLVAPEGPNALSLRIAGPLGTLDLGRTLFRVEQYRESGDVDVVRFVAEGPLERDAILGAPESLPSQAPALRVERIYRVGTEPYDIEMEVRIEGLSNPRQDHNLILGWEQGIPGLETQPKLEQRAKAAVAMLAQDYIQHGYGGGGFACRCGGGPASRGGEQEYRGLLRWAGVRSKYFGGLLVPFEELEAAVVANSEPSLGLVGMRIEAPLAYEGRTVKRFRFYGGPIDYDILKDLEERIDVDVSRLVDFGGSLIAPISKATRWFLVNAHKVVPNYGVVIVLLALLVRLVFHPLNIKSLESQRKLQALKPLLDEINKTYKDDPEKRTKKTMELHKQYGVNPLGGCLPLLVQLPVIYALYNVLLNAIELRKAPFMLWMQDLSAPDTVGEMFGVPINILPVLMALTMFWQQKMTPTDPRQAPMMLLMPVMMVFFFYGMPSGLVLYWTVTNLLAVGQQMMMKPVELARVPEPAGAEPEKAPKFGSKRSRKK